MDKFKVTLEKRRSARIALLAAIVCVFAGFGALHIILKVALSDDPLQSFVIGFSVGIFLVAIAVLIKDIMDCSKALKGAEALKKLYIKENDERTKLIDEKIGGPALWLLFYAVTLGGAVASFWNVTVALTLICVTACIGFIKAALKIYYSKKY